MYAVEAPLFADERLAYCCFGPVSFLENIDLVGAPVFGFEDVVLARLWFARVSVSLYDFVLPGAVERGLAFHSNTSMR